MLAAHPGARSPTRACLPWARCAALARLLNPPAAARCPGATALFDAIDLLLIAPEAPRRG